MRRWTSLVLAAGLALAGCWSGAPFYDATDAVPVLQNGSYRLTEPGSASSEGDRIIVRNQPDGTMLLTGADHPWQGIAVPADRPGTERFLLQLRQGDETGSFAHSKALYMLLDVQAQGTFVTILPCSGPIADGVKRAGGSVTRDPQSASSCTFPDKKTLTAQLAILLREAPDHDIELKRAVP